MSESDFKRDYTKSDRFALQYFYDDEEKKAKEMTIENDHVFGSEYESGGSGLISTVDDYLKFAETMTYKGLSRSGTRILSEKYVDILRTNQLSEKQLPDLDWIQLKGYGYGLGVRTLMDPKHPQHDRRIRMERGGRNVCFYGSYKKTYNSLRSAYEKQSRTLCSSKIEKSGL